MQTARPDFVECLNSGANRKFLRNQHDPRTMFVFREISQKVREMSGHSIDVMSQQDAIEAPRLIVQDQVSSGTLHFVLL